MSHESYRSMIMIHRVALKVFTNNLPENRELRRDQHLRTASDERHWQIRPSRTSLPSKYTEYLHSPGSKGRALAVSRVRAYVGKYARATLSQREPTIYRTFSESLNFVFVSGPRLPPHRSTPASLPFIDSTGWSNEPK